MTSHDPKISEAAPNAEGKPEAIRHVASRGQFHWLADRSSETLQDLEDVCRKCIVLPPSQERTPCADQDCPLRRLQALFKTVEQDARR